jgi:hypothetical protein
LGNALLCLGTTPSYAKVAAWVYFNWSGMWEMRGMCGMFTGVELVESCKRSIIPLLYSGLVHTLHGLKNSEPSVVNDLPLEAPGLVGKCDPQA